jgi:hypothetical protein
MVDYCLIEEILILFLDHVNTDRSIFFAKHVELILGTIVECIIVSTSTHIHMHIHTYIHTHAFIE